MYYMVCMSDDLKIGVVICLWLIRIYNELKLMFYMRLWNDELDILVFFNLEKKVILIFF